MILWAARSRDSRNASSTIRAARRNSSNPLPRAAGRVGANPLIAWTFDKATSSLADVRFKAIAKIEIIKKNRALCVCA
jgi:hypothetical protein